MSATPPSGNGNVFSLRHSSRAAKLTELNEDILRYVRDTDRGQQAWEFSCECDRATCREHVFLTLDAYVALRDSGGAVLAAGHQLGEVERARRLRAESEALRRQAAHQLNRATKNLRASGGPRRLESIARSIAGSWRSAKRTR